MPLIFRNQIGRRQDATDTLNQQPLRHVGGLRRPAAIVLNEVLSSLSVKGQMRVLIVNTGPIKPKPIGHCSMWVRPGTEDASYERRLFK